MEIPLRAGPKSWKKGSMEFLVPRRSSCVSCGGGGVVRRRVHGGAGCSARQSRTRRAELGFVAAVEARTESMEAAGGIYKAAGSNLGRRAERGDHGRDLGVACERAEEVEKKELQLGQGCQWEEATVLRPRAGSGRPWSGVAASGPYRAGCGALRAAVACRVLGRARGSSVGRGH